MKTLRHHVLFPTATPEELFDLYADANAHAQAIGAAVEISTAPGSPFSAFDGAVRGQTLLVVPSRLIVQSWRGNVWEEDDADSVCVLSFEPSDDGAAVDLVHANCPDQFEDRWNELYWLPWQRHLARRSRRVERPTGLN